MKNIVVCYKWVLDDADIKVNAATRELDFSKATRKISEYDRNVLEAAVRLKALMGESTIWGITCGADTEPSAKDALSRGADSALVVNDNALADADSQVSAKVLAALVNGLEDIGVVLCGEGSSDAYAQQTGTRIAALLGWPVVSNVSKIEVNGDKLILTSRLEEGNEVLEASMPLVVNVLPEIFEAPIPGFKQIMAAKKKPIQAKTLAETGVEASPAFKVVSVLAPVNERKARRMNPDGVSVADAARELARELKAQGLAE